MLNAMKAIQGSMVWMRTSGISTSTFFELGSFRIGGIGPDGSIKSFKVFADKFKAANKQLSSTEIRRIKAWLNDNSMNINALKEAAPEIKGLSKAMNKVDVIAISPGFEAGLRKKGVYNKAWALTLNLEDVLKAVEEFEARKSDHHILESPTIIDRQDPGATQLDGYQSDFAGGFLYKVALQDKKILPFRVSIAYKKDTTGFYSTIESSLGKNFELGIFEPEFAFARMLFDEGVLSLVDIAAMAAAVQRYRNRMHRDSIPGEALTDILTSKAPAYLAEFNRRLEVRIRKFCTKIYQRLLVLAPSRHKEIRKTVAILTWGIRAKKLNHLDAEKYLKEEYESEREKYEIIAEVDDLLDEVRNHLATEEKQKRGIFSLGLVINIITEIELS